MDGSRADVDRRNTLPRLTTAQAADRLGVKPATLYAYVSRGLLGRQRTDRGGSTFDALEVEAFAARRRRPVPHSDEGTPLMVLDSSITRVGRDTLAFRGIDATELARSPFERAVGVLWQERMAPAAFHADPAVAAAVRAAATAAGARGLDALRVAALVSARADPHREDRRPGGVHAAGARLIAAMIDGLPDRRDADGTGTAARLWARLAGRPPEAGESALLDAALVLTMDHDLAASTFAARVAASARADPYACVQSALGAFGGELHGAAVLRARDLLEQTLDCGDPVRALSDAVMRSGAVPGFGHVLYRRRDPRADRLFAQMEDLAAFRPALAAAGRLTAVVAERLGRPATIDLALAVLGSGAGFDRDGAATLFAIGRTAGWIAHVVDEYAAPALRLRPRARYSGTPAGSDRRQSRTASTGPVSTSSE